MGVDAVFEAPSAEWRAGRAPCCGDGAALWRPALSAAALPAGTGAHCGPQGRVRRDWWAVETSCASGPAGQGGRWALLEHGLEQSGPVREVEVLR